MIALSRPRNRPSGHVRIIGGKWRGRKLPVISQDGLRPTTDRSKETLFNWLMQHIRSSVCLDAFAGSGSLGLEAISRGAESVTFIETSKPVARQIADNCSTLGISADIVQGNALTALTGLNKTFDGIFADPPFHQNLLVPFVELVLSHNLLTDGGWLYVEYEADKTLPLWPALELHREKRTSQFVYALYFKSDTAT